MRASLPVTTFPIPPTLGRETGLGELNVFAACLLDTGNAVTAGIDPQIMTTSATEDALGSEKWSVGLVHTVSICDSKGFSRHTSSVGKAASRARTIAT